jgi:hypothetical protein
MKKLTLSLAILISIITPYKLHAFDITVGATTWYAWWDATYVHSEKIGTTERNIKTDPTFLYGPVLSFKFNDNFNLTFVFLYGKFNQSDIKKMQKTVSLNHIYRFTTDTVYKRSDADLALNYKLNDYFKVFSGIKYMAYKAEFSGKAEDLSIPVILDIYTGRNEPIAYGPGLGLNCAFPVIDNLFILGTLSGFYLWGEEKGSIEIIGAASSYIYDFDDKFNYKEYGINSNLALAYYLTNISTVISLGGRLQYFKTDCGNIKDLYTYAMSTGGGAGLIYNANKIHKIYGITLTSTYNFSI